MNEELVKETERKRHLESLASDQGYLLLSSYIQEQIDRLQHDILFTPCTSIDSAIAQEYNKGKLEGRLSLEAVRAAMVESLSIRIAHLKELEEDEHTDGSTDGYNAP